MPIHRHLHDKLGSVYALRWELDAWSQSRNLPRSNDAGAVPLVGLDSPTDERRVSLRGSTFDEGSVDARTESDPATKASARWRRARQWPLIWLTIGAGAVLALGTAVWLLNRADYFWRNPLAEAQIRRVDFEGTEQVDASSREGEAIAFFSDRGGLMLIELDPHTTKALSYTTPNTPGAMLVIVNMAFNGPASSSVLGKGLAVDATGVTETAPSAAELSLPLDRATGVTTTKPFNWTAVPGAVHLFIVSDVTPYPYSFSGRSYIFLTLGTSTIPDLTSDGLFLPASTAYTWGLDGVGQYASVEAASAASPARTMGTSI